MEREEINENEHSPQILLSARWSEAQLIIIAYCCLVHRIDPSNTFLDKTLFKT